MNKEMLEQLATLMDMIAPAQQTPEDTQDCRNAAISLRDYLAGRPMRTTEEDELRQLEPLPRELTPEEEDDLPF